MAMLKTPGVKKHFANLSDITWEVRTNTQDECTNNATTLQETQDESVEVEEVEEYDNMRNNQMGIVKNSL